MDPLAEAVPGRRFVAPDLRGRGGSRGVGAPYGVAQHAADVVALLAELDLREVLLTGHSMGAFVAVLVAHLAPERISRVVLLDGGTPVNMPFFLRPWLVRRTFAAQAKRVAVPVDSGAEYVDRDLKPLVAGHPEARAAAITWIERSLAESGSPLLEAAALPVDGVSCMFDRAVRAAGAAPARPTTLLYAEWGRGDGVRPFYGPAYIDRLVRQTPNLTAQQVKGTNHLTLLLTPEVAAALS